MFMCCLDFHMLLKEEMYAFIHEHILPFNYQHYYIEREPWQSDLTLSPTDPHQKNGFFTSFRLRRGDYPMNGMDVKKINRNRFHIPGQSDISARRFFCLIRAIT